MERLKSYNYPINLLVDVLDDDDSVQLLVEEQLKRNGITNYRMFADPDDFIKHQDAKPHICLIDFRLPGNLNGLQVSEIVLAQNPDCQLIMLTAMDGLLGYEVMKKFHRIDPKDGKSRKWWVDKNEAEWEMWLTTSLQQAIRYIKDLIDIRERLEAIEGSVIRKNRQPLSSENTNCD